MELRCRNKMFGVIVQPAAGGVLEIKCNSDFCGAQPGVVVLHRFSTADGRLISTSRFRDTPTIIRKSQQHT